MALPTFTVAPVRAAQLQALVDRIRLARKTADESVTSSTTFQDDNDLFLSVEANTIYNLDLWLIVNSVNTTDIKYTWSEPSGTTMQFHLHIGSLFTGPFTQGSTVIHNTDGSDQVVTMQGIVTVGANAGNLQLQWAQDTSGATSTTVKAGSWLRLIQQT